MTQVKLRKTIKPFLATGLYHDIKVYLVSSKQLQKISEHKKEKNTADTVCVGVCDSYTGAIYLDESLNGAKLLHVFFHEMVHMIDAETRLIAETDEEARIDAIAAYLLRLNPQLKSIKDVLKNEP